MTIAFSAFDLDDWPWGGETGFLALYSSRTWTDLTGVVHLSGLPKTLSPVQRCPITVDGRRAQVTSFHLAPTVTSVDLPNVRLTGVLLDANGNFLKVLFNGWYVPARPDPITWTTFTITNHTKHPRLTDRYGTWQQVLDLFSQFIGTVLAASSVILGAVRTSVDPAVAGSPIAVEDSDPRVPTQDENDAMVGTGGLPSAANPFLTNEDPRLGLAAGLSGRAVLVADTATLIEAPAIAINSGVKLVAAADTITGNLRPQARIAGTSFEVKSDNGADEGDFLWFIVTL